MSITDTVPAEVFESVTKYYHRKGYTLKSFTLVGSSYEAKFVK